MLRKYGPPLYKGTVAGAGVAAAAAPAAEKKVTIAKSEQTVGKPFKVVTTSQGATSTAADQGFKVPKPTSTQFGMCLSITVVALRLCLSFYAAAAWLRGHSIGEQIPYVSSKPASS